MLFTSLTYLFFLLAATLILYLVPGRYQWLWLLVCSIAFYYTLLPVYLILFFALVLLNYYLGIAIDKSEIRKELIFIYSVCINIIVLAFFKYAGFFRSLFTDIQNISGDDRLLRVILPVGLSFFIFTILSYLIEVKRGTIKAERHIGIFASSLLFFPKIMQGPIEKPGKIFPQFREAKSFNYDMVADGLKLMLWGYFKKLVIADRLAIYVNAVYGNYENHSGLSLLVATILYSFQIYTDFSGYTDIAIGSGKVLGFNLTNNFNRPYLAISIKDFWNRWHISFSVWLRDYLFLPLAAILAGKSKKGKYLGLRVDKWIFTIATMITFTVCGIWHGEGINFLLWGLIFGIYLTIANWSLGINKKLREMLRISKKSKLYKAYNIPVTFILVTIAWIFFRADTAPDAFNILAKIISFKGQLFFDYQTFFYGLPAILFLFFIELRAERQGTDTMPFRIKGWFKEQVACAGLLVIIFMTGVLDGGQFIYFQF